MVLGVPWKWEVLKATQAMGSLGDTLEMKVLGVPWKRVVLGGSLEMGGCVRYSANGGETKFCFAKK